MMAGGLGTRLHPLTHGLPKPLVEVGGRPLLETMIEALCNQGLRSFLLSVNYKGEMIERRIGDGSQWGVRIEYIRESTPLGTAGALGLMPRRPPHSFLVMNADLLTNLETSELLAFHAEQGADATICTYQHRMEVPYGVVEVDGSRLTAIEERPHHRFVVNAGIYALEPSVLDLVPPNRALNMPNLLAALLAAGRKVAAFPIRDYWLDIADSSDLARANADFPHLDLPRFGPLGPGSEATA